MVMERTKGIRGVKRARKVRQKEVNIGSAPTEVNSGSGDLRSW